MSNLWTFFGKALLWEGFCRRLIRPIESIFLYFAAFLKMGLEEDPGLVILGISYTLIFISALFGIAYLCFTI